MVGKPGRGRRDAADWAVLTFRWIRGESFAEIAASEGVTEQWARYRINRELNAGLDAIRRGLHAALERRLAKALCALNAGEPEFASRMSRAVNDIARAARSLELMMPEKKDAPPKAQDAEPDVDALRAELRRRMAEYAERREQKRMGGPGEPGRSPEDEP